MARKSVISKYFSKLAKLSHKKSPRGRKFYQMMAKKRWGKVALTNKNACDRLKEGH
jgi:hypothetical protein